MTTKVTTQAPKTEKNTGGNQATKQKGETKPLAKVEDKKEEPKSVEKAPDAPAKPTEATPAQQVVEQKVNEKMEAARLAPGQRKIAGEDATYSYSGQGDGCRSNADIRSKVLDLFMAHPGEILTYPEVAHKLSISKHHAWTATRDLEDMEDLVEAKSPRNNKKGHKLSAQYAEQAKEASTES
jgi:hypothetical protein